MNFFIFGAFRMEDRYHIAKRADDDTVFELVVPLLASPRDRGAASLVSRRWYEMEAITRKHVTIALCYAATPAQLSWRFPNLESLKVKGKPRAAKFGLIPEKWGGFVTPWVEEMSSRSLSKLKSLHLRRMIVSDADLSMLASHRGPILQVLKLDNCSDFSTDGLFHITCACRNLKTLFLEDSRITDIDGKWLHEIAQHHTVLQNLNFYLTDLRKVDFKDLEVIARKCPLISLKISDCDLEHLVHFFQASVLLEEFVGGSVDYLNAQVRRYDAVKFPPKLCSLGLTYLENRDMQIVFPVAARIEKLDLMYAFLDTEGHCQLLRGCPNLEILQARSVIGDRGLETVAEHCKRLRRLRISRVGGQEHDVTQRGIMSLSQGCTELEYLAVYVTDITNAALESVGAHLKKLSDFRLVLLNQARRISGLPLDNGVRSLLTGCTRLTRLGLGLRARGLTDVGLGYIGQYSANVKWMFLRNVGESDAGLISFSTGCPSLQKLEVQGCDFSEQGIAVAALQLRSLKYLLWVPGYQATSEWGQHFLGMLRPSWNIELFTAGSSTMFAYYSLAGQRTDFPPNVIPLH